MKWRPKSVSVTCVTDYFIKVKRVQVFRIYLTLTFVSHVSEELDGHTNSAHLKCVNIGKLYLESFMP